MKLRLKEFPFKKPLDKAPHIKIHCGLCKEGKYPDGVPRLKESLLENKGGFRYKYWKYHKKR